MPCLIKNIKAQVIAEYSIVLSIAILAVVSMMFFIKRGLQARVNDARAYMIHTLDSEVDFAHNGIWGGSQPEGLPAHLYEYEPYYQNQQSLVTRDGSEKDIYRGAAGESDYTRKSNTTVQTNRYQAPAKNDFWNGWNPGST